MISIETSTIVVLLSITVLLGALYYYRIRIRLFLHRIIYGKFSYNHLALLNKFFLESKFPPSIRYEPLYYLHTYYDLENMPENRTDNEIDFNGYKPGQLCKNFYKINGKPEYFTITNPNDGKIRIVVAGYNKRLYQYESTLLYFFIDNTFIMGQYLFKREKQEVDAVDLSEKLQIKYLGETVVKTLNDFIIKNDQGAKVLFRDNGFNVEVSIFNPVLEEINEKLLNRDQKTWRIPEEVKGKAASITF